MEIDVCTGSLYNEHSPAANIRVLHDYASSRVRFAAVAFLQDAHNIIIQQGNR